MNSSDGLMLFPCNVNIRTNLSRLLLVTLAMLVCATADGFARNPHTGIWISSEEIQRLRMSGRAWNNLRDAANRSVNPNLKDQNDRSDSFTFAKALVYARTGQKKYADEVVTALKRIVATKSTSWDWLAVCRSFSAYAIAGDLIDLKNYDPAFDNQWRRFLADVRTFVVEGGRGSIVSAHENRPNNYGTHAGASRIAIDLYLGDTQDVTKAVHVFQGWLGDRSSYAGFKYGDLSWQCDSRKPIGINAKGCTESDHNIDGVLPDDQRRSGTFTWPPSKENYVYEALQGVVVMAELLYRQGFPVYDWSDRAILRAYQWLHTSHFTDGTAYSAKGDDKCGPWVINKRYDTHFPQSSPCSFFKSIGWTDWTHAP